MYGVLESRIITTFKPGMACIFGIAGAYPH